MGSLLIKEELKTLCSSNGWSYGVFWRMNRPNSMLLTVEDSYFEEPISMVVDKMLQQVHMLGQGIIGETAFTGKHRWLFSDTYFEEWGYPGSVDNENTFQDNSEFHHQFSSGIKTIAVVSVAPLGVLQFGSMEKILESLEFVDHAQSLFRQLGSHDGLILSGSSWTPLNSEICDQSGSFASVVLPGNSFPNSENMNSLLVDNSCKRLTQTNSLEILPQSTSFTSEMQNGSMTTLIGNSFHPKNKFQVAGPEAQVTLSTSTHLTQALLQSTNNSAHNSIPQNTNTSIWSEENPTMPSFEQQMLTGTGMHGSPKMSSANLNIPESCSANTTPKSVSGLDSHEINRPIGSDRMKLVDIRYPIPLSLATEGEIKKALTSFLTFPVESFPSNAATVLSEHNLIDNPQWVAPPSEQTNNELATKPNDNLSQSLGLVSVETGFSGSNVLDGVANHHVDAIMINPMTKIMNSTAAVHNGKEHSCNLPLRIPTDNELFDSLGLNFGYYQGNECWDDIIMPPESSGCSSLSTIISECISELDVGSKTGARKSFFSEFGIEQLLNDVCNSNSVVKPSTENPSSTSTVTRTGSTSGYSNQVQLAGLSCLGGSMDVMLPEPESTLERMKIHGSEKEPVSKPQVGRWIDDSYSINTESAVNQTKRPEEPAKVTRKRARPGETTRPRPKDRQQIQDRVKELREIVPNGAKCSIDALLDRTIKHMLFLQSVTKYADKLKKVDEPKMIGEENGVVLKDNSSGSGGGTTWAFEVGGQTMVCPIIVEDLSPPGQMLVEMLCEERGLFLEIADIIRGFGLTILKGVMEARDDKIWARFVVEANRDVTRMDIFLSLVQLLQQTTTGGIGPSKVIDIGVPPFTNYQQTPMPLPISLVDRMQ
ncbi:PREDICTED: uncharacterized protein LOC104594230 isoform X2 [Nelumbo nucifera]|uniref:BHLH domain-containing protein n=2 Tax=Nelumbo nucifera TaxID=4432 RepID=A0A822YYC4_NELNU|nr:PREDICTED: uncharacterized protein LOC104594230 isoform X2 [Nelumbo nucifera]DAD36195.1 TPA_asm: hypothetical protein HUJ06_006835 [Nelumbo nucifera]